MVLSITVAAGLVTWPWLGNRLTWPLGMRAPTGQSQGVLETLGVYGEVPDFALTERSGRTITRADLLGKVWIANFIYTQCTETCPLQSVKVAQLQAEFRGEKDLRLVSITVDPERDTPEVLARYAERYQADLERWLFLTGPKRALYHLAADGFKLNVVDPDDRNEARGQFLGPRPAFASHGSKGLVIHSSRLVLVDRLARIRAYHQPADPESFERLRRNVRTLLKEA
ncbi:MAG: SCO family protein [Candidatus Methylomirabilales bacterium]